MPQVPPEPYKAPVLREPHKVQVHKEQQDLYLAGLLSLLLR